jgi:hypothetical protein
MQHCIMPSPKESHPILPVSYVAKEHTIRWISLNKQSGPPQKNRPPFLRQALIAEEHAREEEQ